MSKERQPGSVAVRVVQVTEYPWTRKKLKDRYRIPEATLIRWLTGIIKENIPEFGYTGYQATFDPFQVFTIRWLKTRYRRGLRTLAIINQINNGELTDEYEKATESRPST